MSIKKFSAKQFENRLLDLMKNKKHKDDAVNIENEIKKEDYLLNIIMKQKELDTTMYKNNS